MNYKKGLPRNQIVLFSECLDTLIEKDNPVRVIDAYIEQLDLDKLGFKMPELKTGAPPYDNKVLLKIYFYGFLDKTRSSRRLEKECRRNQEMIWLTNSLKPTFKTISDFRNKNHKGMKNIFGEFLHFCHKLNLIDFETVATDGTKIRAQNSTNNVYARKEIDKVREKIEKRIEEYLATLDAEDKKEDGDIKLGKSEVEDVLEKLEKLKKHKKKLEKVKAKFENDSELKTIYVTDEDSRFQSDKGKIRPGYNPQITSDSKHSLLISNYVTNKSNDLEQMTPMLKKLIGLKKELGVSKKTNALFDAGYFSEVHIMENEANPELNILTPSSAQVKKKNDSTRVKKSKERIPAKGFEARDFIYNSADNTYTCPTGKIMIRKGLKPQIERSGRETLEYRCLDCAGCIDRPHCTKDKNGRAIKVSKNRKEIDTFLEKLSSESNKKLYSKRKEIVEHPFGTIKRNWGYTYFMQKGLKNVNAEFSFMCFIYNFKRVTNILTVERMLDALTS